MCTRSYMWSSCCVVVENVGIRGNYCSLYREKFFFKSSQVSKIESFVSFPFFLLISFFSTSLLNWRLECYGVRWKFRWNGENETLIKILGLKYSAT